MRSLNSFSLQQLSTKMIWPPGHAAVETVLFGILFVLLSYHTVTNVIDVTLEDSLVIPLLTQACLRSPQISYLYGAMLRPRWVGPGEVFPFPVLCQLKIELPFKVALMNKIVYVKWWKNLQESISILEWSRWRNRALSPHSPPLCASSCSIELLSCRVSGNNFELCWVLK